MRTKGELQSTHKELFSKLQSMLPLYRDVRDYINPYIGNFDQEEPSKVTRHDQHFLRTTPLKYTQIMAAGIQSGITSPTKKWLKLYMDDQKLMQDTQVKIWLSDVENIVFSLLTKGHFYEAQLYANLELGCFGTSALMIEEDFKTGVRFKAFSAGEYAIDVDSKGLVNSFARKFKMSAKQLCDKFPGKATDKLKREAKSGSHMYYNVYHLIIPNDDYDPSKWDNQHFRYAEYYWSDITGDDLLSKSGYHEFPVAVSRWQQMAGSIYGVGPGIWAIGDARELQLTQHNLDTIVAISAKPPLQAPADILANGGVNVLPSAVNYYNPMNGNTPITPIYDSRSIDKQFIMLHRQTLEEAIKEHFHVNVFQLLSDMDKGTRTAREIIELSAEKMSQMGPLVDRQETETLPRIVERVLSIGFRNGYFPEPPDVIKGQGINVSFDSILSRAQRQSDITPIMDTIESAIAMANNSQIGEILDNIDFDATIRKIADLNGLDPRLIKPQDVVNSIRQQRAIQQQQLLQQQQQQMEAEKAKTLSQAKTNEPSALTQLLGGAVQNALQSY